MDLDHPLDVLLCSEPQKTRQLFNLLVHDLRLKKGKLPRFNSGFTQFIQMIILTSNKQAKAYCRRQFWKTFHHQSLAPPRRHPHSHQLHACVQTVARATSLPPTNLIWDVTAGLHMSAAQQQSWHTHTHTHTHTHLCISTNSHSAKHEHTLWHMRTGMRHSSFETTYVSLQEERGKGKKGWGGGSRGTISSAAQSLYSESRWSRLERDGISYRGWIVVIASVSVYGIERKKKEKLCVCVLPTPPPGWTDELIIFAPRTPSSLQKRQHTAELPVSVCKPLCVCVCVCARVHVCRTLAFALEFCLWTIYCKSSRDKERWEM